MLPWIQCAVVLAIMTALAVPMSHWLVHCFGSEHHTWVERLSYRAMGVDPAQPMGWAFLRRPCRGGRDAGQYRALRQAKGLFTRCPPGIGALGGLA